MEGSWDPAFNLEDGAPPPPSVARIRLDLKSIFEDPFEGILVVPSEDDVRLCHALILGPDDTPYEGGCFIFQVGSCVLWRDFSGPCRAA